MEDRLKEADVIEGVLRETQQQPIRTVADIEAINADLTRPFRSGAGELFVPRNDGAREFRRQAAKAREDAGSADAPRLLQVPLFVDGPLPAERDAGAEDGDAGRDHPGVPAPRRHPQCHAPGSRLVGRPAPGTLRARDHHLRDPVSPAAAVLSRRGLRISSTRRATRAPSAQTTHRSRTFSAPTRWSATTSGTSIRAS